MASNFPKISRFQKLRFVRTLQYRAFSLGRPYQQEADVVSGPKFDPIVGMTIQDYAFSHGKKHGDQVAFSCAFSKRSYTFNQIYTMSHSFAAALKQNGLNPGDTVGIMVPNLPEYPIIEFGVWLAGGVVSPISSTFTTEEVVRQCTIADVKIVVTFPLFLPIIQAVKSKIPIIKSIINVGEKEEGCHCFSEMVKVDPKGVELFSSSKVDTLNDIVMLPFSSGTTGPPKGVMVTHNNMISNCEQLLTPGVLATTKADRERFLGILPFYHCFGFGAILVAGMKMGANTLAMPKFDPAVFIECLRSHKPTILHIAPPMAQFIAFSPEITKSDLASIETIVCGASYCGSRLIKSILDKADSNLFFQEGYGMTEATVATHLLRLRKRNGKEGSIGEPLPGTSCKIIDPDTGKPVPRNKPGELWVKGPQITKGYYKNEEATKETFEDGWLKTGDIMLYDDDNCFRVVGRLKELIKVKGLQVSPSELEDILRTSKDIADVAVVGVRHERLGEAPRAFIVLKPNAKLTENQVHDFLERKIAPHKKLAGGVQFIDQIPKALSGKILRKEIVRLYIDK